MTHTDMTESDLPLSGYRILDLTRVWSGPLATRILADMGAEVITVTGRITISRNAPPREQVEASGIFPDDDPGDHPWNRSALANDLGRNKEGLTLELNSEQGVALFRQLVQKSDVVIENFSPRVMQNFGLDYQALKQLNPGLVMCSMPGYGLTGPNRNQVSFGANLECYSGLASLTGYAGDPGHLGGNPYPDPTAAVHAAGAVLTALFYRLTSGKGQYIDLAQSEAMTCLIGEEALGYALCGKNPLPNGNRHRSVAPQGIYPAAGDDRWIAIAVHTDAEWRSLVDVMSRDVPSLHSKRFSSHRDRLRYHDEIDRLIGSWTSKRSHTEAMMQLQEKGVPAGAVWNAEELVSDPQLNERGFFWEIDHPEVGKKTYCGLPVHMSGVPCWPKRPAPCLGEHNRSILKRVLGYSDSEVQRLVDDGVVGTEPMG